MCARTTSAANARVSADQTWVLCTKRLGCLLPSLVLQGNARAAVTIVIRLVAILPRWCSLEPLLLLEGVGLKVEELEIVCALIPLILVVVLAWAGCECVLEVWLEARISAELQVLPQGDGVRCATGAVGICG